MKGENNKAVYETVIRNWVAGYFGSFTTRCWESGQRIVIKKSTDESQYENYEMINPQDGSSAWLT